MVKAKNCFFLGKVFFSSFPRPATFAENDVGRLLIVPRETPPGGGGVPELSSWWEMRGGHVVVVVRL